MVFVYLIILLVTLLIIKYAKRYYYFKSRGIPAGLPSPLFGLEMIFQDPYKISSEKRKRYGKIYGEYLGEMPYIVIGDPDMAKIITVKEFANFSDRNSLDLNIEYFNHSFFMKKGKEWKDGRALVSPVFTTKKIKDIFVHFEKASKPLFLNIEELIEQGKQDEIDIRALLKGYSLDVIAKFVYAIEFNSAKDKDHPFVQNVTKLVQFNSTLINLVFGFLPNKLVKLLDIQMFDKKSLEYLANITRLLMKERKENQTKEDYNDFLDLLLKTIDEKNLVVPEEEIIGNCILFFFAGLETVTITISVALHCLALNLEWQNKLHDELIDLYPTKEITYENLKDSKLLDAILKESQRMFPAVNFLFRVAENSIEIKGLKIEANDIVGIDVYNLHNSSEFWVEPQKYNPNRFLEKDIKFENDDSMIFLPFGSGPRSCIASRMALAQSRYVIAQMVLNYEIYRTKYTTVPLKKDNNPLQLAFKKMILGFKKRS